MLGVARAVMLGAAGRGVSAPWTPGELFAAGELGAWYDPSDLSSMWQDSAGTVPVTAAGQPVGRIADKSGRGNPLTQPTDTRRPTLAQDADSRYYLSFDGLNDALVSASPVNMSGVWRVTAFTALRHLASQTSTGVAWEHGTTTNTVVGAFATWLSNVANGDMQAQMNFGGSQAGRNTGALTPPHTAIYTADYDMARTPVGQFIGVRRNGASFVFGGTNGSGVNACGSYALHIGARGGTSLHAAMHLYALAIRGSATDLSVIEQAEFWMAEKSGVSL